MTDRASLTKAGKGLLTAMLALTLAGCGLMGEPNEIIVQCPTTGVLAAGERFERYTPNSEQDLTDLIARAQIGGIRNVCTVLKEERIVEMDLLLDVAVERGPAVKPGEQINVQYFAAIVDAADQVRQRRQFPLAVTFQNTARRAVFNEELFLSIPIPANSSVQDLRVIVGLQLSQEELQRNLDANTRR